MPLGKPGVHVGPPPDRGGDEGDGESPGVRIYKTGSVTVDVYCLSPAT